MALLDESLSTAEECVDTLKKQSEIYRSIHIALTSGSFDEVAAACPVSLTLFGVEIDNLTLSDLGVAVNDTAILKTRFAESLKTSANTMRDSWEKLAYAATQAAEHIKQNVPKQEE